MNALILITVILIILFPFYNINSSIEPFYEQPLNYAHSTYRTGPHRVHQTGFQWDPIWFSGPVGQAQDCYVLPPNKCMNYPNCGLCIKNGKQIRIPGDTQGSFFKEDCQAWAHTNLVDRHIFKERVTTISPPWSAFYPDYEARYPSPISRSTL